MEDYEISSGRPAQSGSGGPSASAVRSSMPASTQADAAVSILDSLVAGAPAKSGDHEAAKSGSTTMPPSKGEFHQAPRVVEKSNFDELVQSGSVLERMNSLPRLNSLPKNIPKKSGGGGSQTTAEEPVRTDSLAGIRTPVSAPAPATPGTDGQIRAHSHPFVETPTRGTAASAGGRLGSAIVFGTTTWSNNNNKRDPFAYLREAASNFQSVPSIFKRAAAPRFTAAAGTAAAAAGCDTVSIDGDKSGCESESSDVKREEPVGFSVPGWPGDPTYNKSEGGSASSSEMFNLCKAAEQGGRQSVHKVARQKGVSSGRTYTSKYRGVHQTFPTRRWEAQFRRNGKPTSLGCFDREEEAARAYDRMMVWCDLHGQDIRGSAKASGNKASGLSLNFDYSEYEDDFEALQRITQDELVLELRRQGRLQAATNTVVPVERPAERPVKRKALAMES